MDDEKIAKTFSKGANEEDLASPEIEEIDELEERIKELNCFYKISEIVNDASLSLDEALQKIVEVIPPSWQYPDIASARIKIREKEYTTEDFEKTEWKQRSDITVKSEKIGEINVVYHEERPEKDDGPFLKEERRLLDTLADLLANFVQEETGGRLSRKELVSESPEEEKKDWEVIIDLLMQTDPRTLLRITRKMVYYLYRNENERVQSLLDDVCPADGSEEAPKWCGINMPNPKQDIDSLREVQREVFQIAKEDLDPERISDLFHRWLKEDKARPLLIASQRRGTPLVEIKEELNRFFRKPESEKVLSDEDKMSIRTELIQRFFTDRLDFVNVAKKYIKVDDYEPLIQKIVGPARGAGKLGGKASGAYLAHKIIQEEFDDEFTKEIGFPKSWYITSDTLMDLIHYNDLDELIHVKYLDPDEIRHEEPFLEQLMKNAMFPSEIVEGLKKILRDLEGKPIIVRSSSLLEDNFGAAFSGKYKSLFLPNKGSEEERLEELMNAIAEVYASTFSADPIEYRRERGLLDFSEEMGILIQEVVGTEIGNYYLPTYGGVAFSKNEFRWSPRIGRDDGVIRIVPGLATRAVDRIGDDYPILASPNRPNLRVNSTVEERVRYSPRYMDVINLETEQMETVEVDNFLQEHANEFPNLEKMVSLYENGNLKTPSGVILSPEKEDMVVTFSKLFDKTDFLPKMNQILRKLEEKIGYPVDVEFAFDGEKLYIVQCRPQSQALDRERVKIPRDIKENRKLFSANKYVTTGNLENLEYIVYVVPGEYSKLESREKMQQTAQIVGELNKELPEQKFILMGPGRWGSRGDIKLGVPVKYREINNTALLVEVAKERGGYEPELSFGTHFFQDLVEADIKYLPLYPEEEENIWKEEMFFRSENKLTDFLPRYEDFEDVIRVVDVSDISKGGTLTVTMDGEANQALAYLEPSDHWEWRMKKVKQMARELDPEVYDVEALYVVGSTKEATAGPESDIDIIVHFDGDEEQKEKLDNWFQRWDQRLIQENEQRIGKRLDSILDVHYITAEDIEEESSWASHITSRYKSARKIPVGRDQE
ncbi:MAG: PEP/pyruvate-binding domain-containing protein [Candidatus Thermoplasmatota archaeon]